MSPILPIESLQDAFELVCYFGTALGVLLSLVMLKRA